MKLRIKQNPYTAWWNIQAMCQVSKLRYREEWQDNQVSTEYITKLLGRDWIRRYMHSEFGMDWIDIDVT